MNKKYELKTIFNKGEEWHAFHEIQRVELFKQEVSEYTPEFHDNYFCKPAERSQLLLKFQGKSVGVTTLDIFDDMSAATRVVAIDNKFQGAGHGKVLGEMVREFARKKGVEMLCVNADPDKVGYYQSLGFEKENWDMSEFDDIPNPKAIQMTCSLVK